MRRAWTTAALVAAALWPATAAAETLDIPVMLSLTGSGAFLGTAERRSVELLESYTNDHGGVAGRQVHFVFSDDQTSPQVAVQLAMPIVAAHPAVMLGPSLVATCNAVAPLVKDGPVVYCVSPGIHPPSGSYVFTIPIATRDGQEALVRYFRLRGWTRIALLASTDATGHEAETDLDSVLGMPENKTVTLVGREHFNLTDVSAIAQMERLKAANPQVLFAWSTGAAVATLFKAAIETGMDVPVATSNGNMTYAQMKQYADFLPQALYMPSSVWIAGAQGMTFGDTVDAAQRRFQSIMAAAKIEPDSPITNMWDAASIVLAGLDKLGPGASATALRDYILGIKDFGGIHGLYDFGRAPQRGIDVKDAVVVRWTPSENTWKLVAKPTGIPLPD